MPKRHYTLVTPAGGAPLAGLGCLLLANLSLAWPLHAGRSDRLLAAVPTAVVFPGAEAAELRIAVQRVDARTGDPVGGAGPLYLTSDYPHIDFPAAPALDAAGQATLRLVLHPPAPGSPCRGRIIVRVILDEEDADDTMGARVVIAYTADPQATGCAAACAGPGTR
jgi:hypothetical protein